MLGKHAPEVTATVTNKEDNNVTMKTVKTLQSTGGDRDGELKMGWDGMTMVTARVTATATATAMATVTAMVMATVMVIATMMATATAKPSRNVSKWGFVETEAARSLQDGKAESMATGSWRSGCDRQHQQHNLYNMVDGNSIAMQCQWASALTVAMQ